MAKAVAKRKRRKPSANPNGRPTKLTQVVADRIAEGVSLGMTFKNAAMACGVHEDTLDSWRKRAEPWKRTPQLFTTRTPPGRHFPGHDERSYCVIMKCRLFRNCLLNSK